MRLLFAGMVGLAFVGCNAKEQGAGDASARDAMAAALDAATASDATLLNDASAGDASTLDAAAGDDASIADAGTPLPDADLPLPDASEAIVLPEDTVLVPPDGQGPVIGTVTGYEMNSRCPFADPARCELPMYYGYDRDTDEWWDILVDELLTSRVDVVMAHGRGCYDPTTGTGGNGNMCPRLLSHLVDAIDRAGARPVIRLGMFDDTGAYQGTRNTVDGLDQSTRFDLGDTTSWRFFWDHNMKIWFDTVPPDLWYRLDGHPVIAFWTLSSFFFQNQQGNASALLRSLRASFMSRYGEDPLFIVDTTWASEDATISTAEAAGVNDWFNPPGNHFSYRSWGGDTWGVSVPGFRDPNNDAGCGAACREVPRMDGRALRDGLAAGSAARFILLEGWTDIAESAGYYRSDAWRYPNQYINIVREYSDPSVSTLRLQAEAADRFSDQTPGNIGTAQYRDGDLDIGRLIDNTGWFVGWNAPGEWIEHAEVTLACGTYRFTARVSSDAPQQAHFEVDGQSLGAIVIETPGWDDYELVHLGSTMLAAGPHDLRFVADSGNVNIDWTFVKRSLDCP